MIDYNDPRRSRYPLIERDRLDVLDYIAASIQDGPSAVDILKLNETLSRVAIALEKLAGISTTSPSTTGPSTTTATDN